MPPATPFQIPKRSVKSTDEELVRLDISGLDGNIGSKVLTATNCTNQSQIWGQEKRRFPTTKTVLGLITSHLLFLLLPLLWIHRGSAILPKDKEPVHKTYATNSLTETERCTAQALLSDPTERENETEKKEKPVGWRLSLDGTWKWYLTAGAREVCHLEEPFLVPLQSTPDDIQTTLDRKRLVLIGDSSVRMLHDYLIGRWLGNITHWPEEWDNHGPSKYHSRSCGGPDTACHYNVYNNGARVTFVWNSKYFTGELENILLNNVGLPDVVVGQHGYWASMKDLNATAKPAIPKSLENAQLMPKKITEVLDRHEMESLYPRAYDPHYHGRIHKIWMTFFDKKALNDYDPDHKGGLYDGTKIAKKLGWDIFERNKLVNEQGRHESAHPMNEVLEIELELLLLILRNR